MKQETFHLGFCLVLTTVTLSDLVTASTFGDRLEELRGRSVFVRIKEQLAAAITFIELDGIARRMILCPPDLPHTHIPLAAEIAEADSAVYDHASLYRGVLGISSIVTCSPKIVSGNFERKGSQATEWVLFTSGTTGLPKLVQQTLSSLSPTNR